jgi:hypothetical protein
MKGRSVRLCGLALVVCLPGAASGTICGPTDEMQDVELYDGTGGPSKESVNAWQSATGLLGWNPSFVPPLTPADDPGNIADVSWCTGTLFADRLFLTAGFCLDANVSGYITPARRVGNNLVSLPPQELAPLMHVTFNYQRDGTACGDPAQPRSCGLRQPDEYPVMRLLEHRRGNLDYAILELGVGVDGQPPTQRYRPAILDISTSALAKANLLTIIQHANGAPKRVASGTRVKITNERISYRDIDTLGGSGGAGILDQEGRLIGLHTHGGCNLAGGENSGITLRAITQASEVIR